MAIEYRLTLAGNTPLEEIAARVFPDPDQRTKLTEFESMLVSDPDDQLGFSLTIRADRDGYFEAEDSDDGWWTWEPPAYVSVTFRMSRDYRLERGTPNMVPTVARVLGSGSEDAALVLAGDTLLLTRVDGVLRKHSRSTWWDHYGFVNQILADDNT